MNKKRVFTTPQVETQIIERVKKAGQRISHNPHITFNQALYVVMGELDKLSATKRLAASIEITGTDRTGETK